MVEESADIFLIDGEPHLQQRVAFARGKFAGFIKILLILGDSLSQRNGIDWGFFSVLLQKLVKELEFNNIVDILAC